MVVTVSLGLVAFMNASVALCPVSTVGRRTGATLDKVAKIITQRQLRNDSGEIMRALDAGESFVLTRNGVAVGELRPLKRRRFVAREAVHEAFSGAGAADGKPFRADVDRVLDQDPRPRG